MAGANETLDAGTDSRETFRAWRRRGTAAFGATLRSASMSEALRAALWSASTAWTSLGRSAAMPAATVAGAEWTADHADHAERCHRAARTGPPDRQHQIAWLDLLGSTSERGEIAGVNAQKRDVAAGIAAGQCRFDGASVWQGDGDFLIALNNMIGGDDRAVSGPDNAAGGKTSPCIDGNCRRSTLFDRVGEIVR